MVESSDRFFLRPRHVLAAKRIDFYDAINLVVYAKLPLVTALRGSDLIAGYLFRDESGAIKQAMSFRGKQDLLTKYATHFDRLSYPVGPSQYEPLLDLLGRANEFTLPFFFHEHHLIVDKRRRAAMFARLYKELQGHVTQGAVTLQSSDSEKTSLLIAGAWMANRTLQNYLDLNGVLPWFESETNLESHALVERVILSDWLSKQPASRSSGSEQNTALPPSARTFSNRFQPWGPSAERGHQTQIGGAAKSQKVSLLGPSSRYPPMAYTVGRIGYAVERNINSTQPPSSDGSDGEQLVQPCFEWEIQPDDLADGGTKPIPNSIPRPVENPIEVTVNHVIPPTPPEEEGYDEQHLPSFLLADKLLKQSSFAICAVEAQPTSFVFKNAAIAPIVAGHSQWDSTVPAVRTVPSATSVEVEVEVGSDVQLGQPPIVSHPPASVRKPVGDSPAKPAECNESANESAVDSRKELTDEPMMTKEEVAAFFKVTPNTIDNWRKTPDFPKAIPLGPGSLRWERAVIRRYKDQRKSK